MPKRIGKAKRELWKKLSQPYIPQPQPTPFKIDWSLAAWHSTQTKQRDEFDKEHMLCGTLGQVLSDHIDKEVMASLSNISKVYSER